MKEIFITVGKEEAYRLEFWEEAPKFDSSGCLLEREGFMFSFDIKDFETALEAAKHWKGENDNLISVDCKSCPVGVPVEGVEKITACGECELYWKEEGCPAITEGDFKPPLEIEKTLVLSTAHVRNSQELEDFCSSMPGDLVLKYAEGVYFTIPHVEDMRELATIYKYYPSFLCIVKYALERGCHAVKLDCDGKVSPALPVFEW